MDKWKAEFLQSDYMGGASATLLNQKEFTDYAINELKRYGFDNKEIDLLKSGSFFEDVFKQIDDGESG